MRRWIPALMVGALALALVFSAGLTAQVKKDPQTGLDRINGRVQSVDKAKSTIIVQQQSGASWTIIYNEKTKFTKANEPSTLDEVKDGVRVFCVGNLVEKENKMTAVRIEVRLPR
jgi:hypothetical protein